MLEFEWPSSSVTTTVTGALKEDIKGLEYELGLFAQAAQRKGDDLAQGGIVALATTLGVDLQPLVYTSRMAAKVDSHNAAVQDMVHRAAGMFWGWRARVPHASRWRSARVDRSETVGRSGGSARSRRRTNRADP